MYSGSRFGTALITILIIACLITAGITKGVMWLSRKKEIVSAFPIVPEKRLVTDGQIVDTLYIYKIQ